MPLTEEEKIKIMLDHFMTLYTGAIIDCWEPIYNPQLQPLNIADDFMKSFNDKDYLYIKNNNIFLNAIVSPASISPVQVQIPINSRVISFDVVRLLKFPHEERIAILLHEYGHAFNPDIKGEQGEFIADDFAFERGYGEALKSSFERGLNEFQDDYDEKTTLIRINRLIEKIENFKKEQNE